MFSFELKEMGRVKASRWRGKYGIRAFCVRFLFSSLLTFFRRNLLPSWLWKFKSAFVLVRAFIGLPVKSFGWYVLRCSLVMGRRKHWLPLGIHEFIANGEQCILCTSKIHRMNGRERKIFYERDLNAHCSAISIAVLSTSFFFIVLFALKMFECRACFFLWRCSAFALRSQRMMSPGCHASMRYIILYE